MRADERRPNGAGVTRRRGGHKHPGTLLRLSPDVAAALDADSRGSGRSKVQIVEDELRRRYKIRAAA